MRFTSQTVATASAIDGLNDRYLADEQPIVRALVDAADPGPASRDRIRETAAELVLAVRRNRAKEGGLDAFLQQYDLSSEEGVLLMCIAEALLRIPDADTADKLIADKINLNDVRLNNCAYVPEPGTGSLGALGLIGRRPGLTIVVAPCDSLRARCDSPPRRLRRSRILTIRPPA